MPNQILKTKLHFPTVQDAQVRRVRLVKKLNDGLQLQKGGFNSKLTLVSAPAGFGKTTLISGWIAGLGLPAAWISLDENDNDTGRFFTYILAGLQMVDPDLGQTIQSTLDLSQPIMVEPLISSLINEITASETPFLLILDDFHTITQTVIHDAIAFLLDHLPPQVHLVIVTREDPQIPFSRLRVRGLLTELRARDLRFTEKETADFFHETMDLDLNLEDIAAIETRTEGWIVGLQLAALTMKSDLAECIPGFIRDFTGNNRYIVDYLTEEVLKRQPPELRSFLLHTSILDRLSGPLCDAVFPQERESVGVEDALPNLPAKGQKKLEFIEESNLFLIPLDHERCWFRYHHLFADLLRNQLKTSHPDLVPVLHRRACEWYEHNDLISEAINHGLAAKDFEKASQLVEQTFRDRMSRGEHFSTMLERLEALPEEIITSRPSLNIMYAWMLAIMLHLDEIEPRLQAIEKKSGDGLTAELKCQISLIRAELARHSLDFTGAIKNSLKILKSLPKTPSNTDMQTMTGAVFNLSYSYLSIGNVANSEKWFTEALKISRAAGSITLNMLAMSGLAKTFVLMGELNQAAEIYQQALGLIAETTHGINQIIPSAIYIHIGFGDLLREWNKLEEADLHLKKGIELGKMGNLDDLTMRDGYLFQAWLKHAEGEQNEAKTLIRQAEALAGKGLHIPGFHGPIDACRAKMLLSQVMSTNDTDNLIRVEKWAENCKMKQEKSWTIPVETKSLDDENNYLILARFLIIDDEPDQAISLLKSLHDTAEKNGRTGQLIEILILQSLALQKIGHIEKGIMVLKKALSRAEPEGYIRIFIEEGKSMERLLNQVVSRGIMPDYAGRLLNALETKRVKTANLSPMIQNSRIGQIQDQLKLDPLSDRELEVLQFLGTDFSGPDIAAKLFVSINTIKTHIKNIYSKLDAHSSYEAVEKAKALNLL